MSQINKQFVLASNASAGAGSPITWLGGKGCFTAEGTWSAGSAILQMQTANGSWITVVNPQGSQNVLTSNGMVYFEAPPGQLRVNITGAASAIYAYVIGQHQ